MFRSACLAVTIVAAAAATAQTAVPVVVTVDIPRPAAVPRSAFPELSRKTVPDYQKVPGLVRKYYTLGDDDRFGGVYLFRDRAAAQAWFTPAWHAKVKATYGVDGQVRYLESPIQIEGRNP